MVQEVDENSRSIDSRFLRRYSWSFLKPKSFQDICHFTTAFASVLASIGVLCGIISFDKREREAQDIRNFSFFFPSISDEEGFSSYTAPKQSDDPPFLNFGMNFKNSGALPVNYSMRVLGVGYWDGESVKPISTVNEDGIDAFFLGKFQGANVASVAPGSEGTMSFKLPFRPLSGREAVCVYFSAIFEPALIRAGHSLLNEHNVEELIHAIAKTVYRIPPQRDLMEFEIENLKKDAGDACGASYPKVIKEVYRQMLEVDAVAAESYRDVVLLSHPSLFQEID